MQDTQPPAVLQFVIENLPAGFDALRTEARTEGYLFIERLVTDWEARRIRFDRKGEVLPAAHVKGVLAGIGGLTVEPVLPDALRMRRFYIRPSYRRSGVGRKLAIALLEQARSSSRLVTVNAAPASFPFWEAVGFAPHMRDGHTHLQQLAAKRS
jgi:GNAT superfamily N-acetyltransferase